MHTQTMREAGDKVRKLVQPKPMQLFNKRPIPSKMREMVLKLEGTTMLNRAKSN